MTIQLSNGKITASQSMLNNIATAFKLASEQAETSGVSRYFKENADIIQNELYCKGFYGDVKNTH